MYMIIHSQSSICGHRMEVNYVKHQSIDHIYVISMITFWRYCGHCGRRIHSLIDCCNPCTSWGLMTWLLTHMHMYMLHRYSHTADLCIKPYMVYSQWLGFNTKGLMCMFSCSCLKNMNLQFQIWMGFLPVPWECHFPMLKEAFPPSSWRSERHLSFWLVLQFT